MFVCTVQQPVNLEETRKKFEIKRFRDIAVRIEQIYFTDFPWEGVSSNNGEGLIIALLVDAQLLCQQREQIQGVNKTFLHINRFVPCSCRHARVLFLMQGNNSHL